MGITFDGGTKGTLDVSLDGIFMLKMMRGSLLVSFAALSGAQSIGSQYGNYSQYGGSPPVYLSRRFTIPDFSSPNN